MSNASAGSSSGHGGGAPKPSYPSIINEYHISEKVLRLIPLDKLNKETLDKLVENEKVLKKKGLNTFNEAQRELVPAMEAYVAKASTGRAADFFSFKLNQQMKKVNFTTPSGDSSIRVVKKVSDYLEEITPAVNNMKREIANWHGGKTFSLLEKLNILKTLKPGDKFPNIEITDEEINSVADAGAIVQLANGLPHINPDPDNQLIPLKNGLDSLISFADVLKKRVGKEVISSPHEIPYLYGSSKSSDSNETRKAFFDAFKDAGISYEKSAELMGKPELPIGEKKRPAESADDLTARSKTRKTKSPPASAASTTSVAPVASGGRAAAVAQGASDGSAAVVAPSASDGSAAAVALGASDGSAAAVAPAASGGSAASVAPAASTRLDAVQTARLAEFIMRKIPGSQTPVKRGRS